MHCWLTNISSYHPSMNLFWECVSSYFSLTKSFFQMLNMFSTLFDIIRIIRSRTEESRTFDTIHQCWLALPKHSTDSERGMKSNKSFKSFILGSKFESSPDSPTKSNCIELFYSLSMDIFKQSFESRLHFLPILILYVINYWLFWCIRVIRIY